MRATQSAAWVLGLGALILLPRSAGAAARAALSSAQYYYEKHAYDVALPLWQKVLALEPSHALAVARVAELMLWEQGRAGIAEWFTLVLEDRQRRFSVQERARLKAKFLDLQQQFLTNQAQNLYLQAQQRIARGDLAQAWQLLNTAGDLDRGQVLVLTARAEVEKSRGQWDAFHQTLLSLHESFPYSAEVVTELAESNLFQGSEEDALALLRRWDGPVEARMRTALAVALAEGGHRGAALPVLRGLVRTRERGAKAISPAVYFHLAQILEHVPGGGAEPIKWYEKFVQAVPAESPAGWDPYRLAELVDEAKAHLALQAPSAIARPPGPKPPR